MAGNCLKTDVMDKDFIMGIIAKYIEREFIVFATATFIFIFSIVKSYHDPKVILAYFGLCSVFIAGRSYVKGKILQKKDGNV